MPTPIRAHAPAAPSVAAQVDAARALALGRSVLATEAMAIDVLQHRLGDDFVAAADAIYSCRGRVVVTASASRATSRASSRQRSPPPARRHSSFMPPRRGTAISA
jgi:hypothetical protein